MSERIVAFFGTSKAKPGEQVYELAYQMGKLLAEEGFVIANGGYGGTMLASAKGAVETGGEVIGVPCKIFGREPNPYITRVILTESLAERLSTLIELGSGYVVFPGSTGTLLELAKVWELKNKSFIKSDKPLILIEGFWEPLVELIGTVEPESTEYIDIVSTPEELRKILVEKI